MSNPWFRLYSEIIDDEKLLMLSFQDRWHYIAILCLKNKGLLDSEHSEQKLNRKIAVKLGLTVSESDELKRRLIEEDLIDDTWQPMGWDTRQYKKDDPGYQAKRQKAYRERKLLNNKEADNGVTAVLQPVTLPDTDTDTDTDKKKERNKTSRFKPPSLEDLKDFIAENQYSVDPMTFFNYYETVGWKVGKNKMKSWQSAVRGWHSRDKKPVNKSNGSEFQDML